MLRLAESRPSGECASGDNVTAEQPRRSRLLPPRAGGRAPGARVRERREAAYGHIAPRFRGPSQCGSRLAPEAEAGSGELTSQLEGAGSFVTATCLPGAPVLLGLRVDGNTPALPRIRK